MKIDFSTFCRSFPVNQTRRTEVMLGNILITFHGNTIYQVFNKRTNEGYYWAELPEVRLGAKKNMYLVDYAEMLFSLNRMLLEQSQELIGPIMDRILGGEK